jgi:hypothetical protein
MENYEAPTSAAFDVGTGSAIDLEYGRNAGSVVSVVTKNGTQQSATQVLVDNFKNKSLGGRGAKVLPIRPAFPAFGPSMFFVSELTAENHAPALEFNYQRDKKDGGK